MAEGRVSIWHRFLSLFCCLSVQTTHEVPRLTSLCEPALVKWINNALSSSGQKVTDIMGLAKDLRFVQLVEAVTNVDMSSLKKKRGWKSRKRLIHKAMAFLVDLKVLKEGEHSGCKIVRGDCDEIRAVVLKLLAWVLNSKNGGQKKEIDDKETTLQKIKSGNQLAPEGKENFPVKESKSELILTSAGSEELREMPSIPRSASYPSFFCGEKNCSLEILISTAVAESKNSDQQ